MMMIRKVPINNDDDKKKLLLLTINLKPILKKHHLKTTKMN